MSYARLSALPRATEFSLRSRARAAYKRTRSAAVVLLLTAACLLLGAARTPAQNVQHTKNAPGIGMRSVFKVNPATNALELSVPLGPTGYPQRGGASVAPAINYSSRIWRIAYSGPINGTPTQQGPPPVVGTRVVPMMAENSRMGWTYSLEAPYVETTPQDAMGGEVYDAWGNSLSMCTTGGENGAACCFIDRIRIHMPGGGTQEFRSSDHPYCYSSSGAPQLPPDLYSVDGSRMRYNRTSNTLFLPDGSYWVLSTSASVPAQYFDRNGNRLLNGFTDGLGRTFANPIDPALGTDYTYTAPGVGGAALTYTFRWRYLNQILNVPVDQLPNFSDDCGSAVCAEPYLFKSDTGADQPIKTQGGASKVNPLVLYQIVLPHDSSDTSPPTYTFTYNVYAEIDKVVYPTGGYERFNYGLVETQQSGTFVYAEGNRGVTDRWVSARGDGTDETHWQYAWTDSQGQLRKGEINPDGTRTERNTYYTSFGITYWSFTDVRAGRPTEERVYNSAGQMLRRKLSAWAVTGSDNCPNTGVYSSCTATRNPRLTKTVEIIIEPGGQALAKTTTYDYDLSYQFTTGINQTSVSEYDFVSVDQNTAQTGAVGSFTLPAQPLRVTQTAYLDAANAAYRERHLLGLATSVEVKDGAGTLAAKSTMAYDEPAYQLSSNYGAVSNWTNPGALRGNATTAGRWLNTTGGYLQTHAQYDQVGNVVVSWDADGNQTQTGYSPTFGYAYPTSVTTAAPNADAVLNPNGGANYPAGTFGSTTGFTSYTDYDPYTGLVTSQTDANGKVTTYNYSDPLDRLKLVTSPDNGTITYEYGRYNNAGRVSDYVGTVSSLDSTRSIISYQYFDGLGRPNRSFLYEGGSPGLFLTSDTQYDSSGRVWRVSNPYRTTGSDQPVNPSGLWTTNAYDDLGRVKSVTTPDGATVYRLYDGTRVLVTDQAQKQRMSKTDALGRLTDVWEVRSADSATGTESVSFPIPASLASAVPAVSAGYRTSYAYDVLGNLRTLAQPLGTQTGQTRTFAYDSLSRLTSATNPESGTVSYTYDANGNLQTRTDARGVQTAYTYDQLNRNILVHYADSVLGPSNHRPDVEHHYDGAPGGLGRLWWQQVVGVVSSAVDSYDVMGRPTQYHQLYWAGNGWGQSFNVSLAYDKAGNVTSQTYPSGHTVKYNYDAAGRLGDSGTQPSQRAFYGNLGDGVERTYSDQITYSELGGIRQERFGTQTPLFHKLHYNRRGQLFDIRLSTQSLQADEWNWNRGAVVNYYGGNYAWEGDPTTPPATDNNGNLRRQQSWAPGDDSYNGYAYAQDTFEYDALNRLGWVSELHGGASGQSAQDFKQYFDYDRWGNRTINAAETWVGQPTNLPSDLVNERQFDKGDLANTNRLYAPGDLVYTGPNYTQRKMQYDAAGNLVFDAYTGMGGRTYDAENRMTGAATDTYGTWAYYTYDADGRRVKRKVGNEEWWQVYGLGGELLAEYRAGSATYLPSKEYGYRGGELLVTMSSGDDQRLKRFVTYLSYGALHRDPTAQELQDTTNQLAAAGLQGPEQLLATAKQVARSLFTQTAYETSPYRTEAQYVSDLYYAYLQRAPDDQGLAGWAGAAGGGATNRGYVCDGFQESGEFAAVVSTLYGGAASDDQRTDTFINRFYLGVYGRGATAAELQQRRGELNGAAAQGLSQVQAAAEAMGRQLFAAQVTDYTITDQQYVTNLYEGFLQRGPDAGGLSFWTGNAAGGAQSRQNVLNSFATSPAFRELSGTLYRETFWLVSDQLGTPRMVADRTGSLAGVKRHDYLPFGEELFVNVGGRTPTQGYGAGDNVRQKFTKKERDEETGLDFFEARYYSSAMGRFTSPDEFKGGPDELYDFVDGASANPTFYAELTIPQSLNKYQYTYNNPLRYTDSDGHCPICEQVLLHPEQVMAEAGEAAAAAAAVVTTAVAVAKTVDFKKVGDELFEAFKGSGPGCLAGIDCRPSYMMNESKEDSGKKGSKGTNGPNEEHSGKKLDNTEPRPKFWKSTRDNAVKGAPKNPQGNMECPTCGKEITGKKVNGRRDYDLDHTGQTWAQRKRFLAGRTRGEVIEAYQRDVRVQCPECNQSHKYEPKNQRRP